MSRADLQRLDNCLCHTLSVVMLIVSLIGKKNYNYASLAHTSRRTCSPISQISHCLDYTVRMAVISSITGFHPTVIPEVAGWLILQSSVSGVGPVL